MNDIIDALRTNKNVCIDEKFYLHYSYRKCIFFLEEFTTIILSQKNVQKIYITIIANIELLFDELEKFLHDDKHQMDHRDADPK